ncbi:MAG TPA: ferric aerobactin receptor [Cytophagales bacterium]|jgi:hypothetical protein|nr:ferric aerobactin receptor [Cytophagales bacterium]
MRKLSLLFVLLMVVQFSAIAQQGVIKGQITSKINNDPIPFANVIIQGTSQGSTSDETGNYVIDNLEPGLYNVVVSYIGYQDFTAFEVEVTNSRETILNIALEEQSQELEGVTIVASGFEKRVESPVSLRSIGTNEIKRAPGANRDISQVVRSLPGVASTPSFRNDIIIRGGAPSENRFYLDGIEIPVINHFQTQGSSGGPVGIINVDFIKKVDFYSGAFPANRGNALSSVFDFVQKEGRNDKWTANFIVGASDLGVTLEGPVDPNSSLIFSARRSYLQFLFSALGLPFLPTYNDFQMKYKYNFDSKNQLTIIGIGAIDNFQLNPDAPENADTPEEREQAEYILNTLPISEQWNYAIGAKYQHFRENGFYTVVLSRSMLNNTSIKYANNDEEDPDNLLFDYLSQEIENKIRLENDIFTEPGYKINFGINYEYAKFFVDDFSKVVTQQGLVIRDFESNLFLNKWGSFIQGSRSFYGDRLSLSVGLRADATDFSEQTRNMLDQFSPRFSLSYQFAPKWSFNFNTGRYYQLPPYTVLGFRDNETDQLVNKKNGVKYIQNDQLVAGLEYLFNNNARITLEGFYKKYDQYPFLIEDSLSLANLGADFGVIGNAPVSSISYGRSYGLEVLLQQKLMKGFYGLLAYTYVYSQFSDKNDELVPSAWDYRHIVSLTGGKKFKKNWELGFRWLYTSQAPFTPYNVMESVRRENWDARGSGIDDIDLLNTQRTPAFHQLDVRLDKKYFFDKWSLNVFLDIQNIYNFQTQLRDILDVEKNAEGQPIPDPENPGFYQPSFLENTSGTILPTIGIIVEL